MKSTHQWSEFFSSKTQIFSFWVILGLSGHILPVETFLKTYNPSFILLYGSLTLCIKSPKVK